MLLQLTTLLAVWWTSISANVHIPQMSELCPYSTFCTTGPRRHIQADNQIPCCLPCSCSDMCTVTGNCCPDKGHGQTNRTNIVYTTAEDPCKQQATLYSKLLNRTMVVDRSRYRVIDICPDEVDRDSNACYTHAAHGINDLMFVSDAKTKDVYLNRFCAQCNGVTDVVYWNLALQCLLNIADFIESFQERDEYIVKSCNIASSPPSAEIGLHSVCYNPVSKCNETGQWNVYDQHLDELCQKSTYGYIGGEAHVVYYANVYCYLCNVRFGQAPLDLCPNIDFVFGGKAGIHGYTSILSFRDHSHQAVDGAQCAESDILDPFTMTCKRLRCPIGQLPSYGSCSPMLDHMMDIFIQFQISLKLASNENSRTFHTRLLMSTHSLVQPTILGGCGLCGISIFKLENQGYYVADIVLYTKDECPFTKLVKNIRAILGKRPLYVQLFETNMNITIEFVPNRFPDDIVKNKVEGLSTMRCDTYRFDFDWNMVTCPTIAYNPDHLISAGVSKSVVESVTRISSNGSDGEFEICLDAYRRIKTDLFANGTRQMGSYARLFCFVLVVGFIYYGRK